jgi:hypothetical protein
LSLEGAKGSKVASVCDNHCARAGHQLQAIANADVGTYDFKASREVLVAIMVVV